MIRRTFLYRNYGKRIEDHFQATLAVVGAAIAKVPTRKTKKKDLSKRLVKKIRAVLNVLYFAFNCFVFCILWSYIN